MSRIELPTTQAHMQDIVDRYGPTATPIGLSQVRSARPESFIDTYSSPHAEDIIVTVNGAEHVYARQGITGVTAGGDMVHSRLHQAPHTVDDSLRYLLVADTVYGSESAEYWTAHSTTRQIGYSAINQTSVTATELIGYSQGLRLVEFNEDTPQDTGLQLLEQALARHAMPQMLYGNIGWTYRVGLEAHETLHDIYDVQKKVVALREELSVTALRQTELLTHELQPTGSDQ